MSNIPKLNHTIDRFNQGCIFFQRALIAWRNGDLLGYETGLRKAATESIGALEWALKVYLRSVSRNRIASDDSPKLRQPNFDDLMTLMQKYAKPPIDDSLVRRLYDYRDMFRNASEHDAAVPPSQELHTAIQVVRQLIVDYLPVDKSRLKTTDLSILSMAALEPKLLAQQLRDWFDTLGYRFESHDIRTSRHFEWIINIPARRGYDRVFVRGVQGEVGLNDLTDVSQVIEEQKVQEGWIVSASRVSQAARDATKEQRGNVFCYTFDELIEESANFSGYLEWLDTEVKRRGIDRMYIPLACIKREFDPVSRKELGKSRYDKRNGWIDGYIDRWLDDPAKEHISILGEFGTGKTWFALHYAWKLAQIYRECKAKGTARPRLPLVIPLRDYAKAVSVESLFSEFFFRKHEIPLAGYSAFEQLNRMGKLLLIFDGFDEMAAKVDRQKMINNFWELARVVVPGAKVILTCRTEHFPEAREGRALLSAELKASTAKLTGEPPQFEILELEPLDKAQIRNLLSFRTNVTTIKRIMSDDQLIDLARRPIMAELIIEALPRIRANDPVNLAKIYLYATRTKMERDIKAERTFTSLADKLYFLCELSWEMLSTDQLSLNYRLFPDRLRRLFGHTVQEQKDLDHWHYDMMGQTMLIRNEDGDYAPAHRSLIEFFVAYKFAAELGVLASDYADLARSQSWIEQSAPSQNYTWSSYFRRNLDEQGVTRSIPQLNEFVTEDIGHLAQSIGKMKVTLPILQFLHNMLDPKPEKIKSTLLSVIAQTQGKTTEEVGLMGGNVGTLLVHHDPSALKAQDLSNTNLCKLDLSWSYHQFARGEPPDLSKANLEAANLQDVEFGFTKLKGANLSRANLTGAKLSVMQFDGLSLHPRGEQLAASSASGILLWDLTSRMLITRIDNDGAWKVAYSPDGTYLVSSLWGGFELRSSQDLRLISTHKNSKAARAIIERLNKEDRDNLWVTAFAFSPDSKLLYAGGNNSVIYVWDLLRHKEIDRLIGHASCIESVSLNADASMLVSAGYKELIVWDTATKKVISRLDWEDINLGNAIFHPNKQTIVSTAPENNVLLLDPISMVTIDSLPFEKVRHVNLAQDGSLLGVGGWGTFAIFDLATLQQVLNLDLTMLTEGEHGLVSVEGICFDQSNEHAFVATKEGLVAIIDVRKGQVLDTLWHLPDVLGANLTHAVGLDDKLSKRLKECGAIL